MIEIPFDLKKGSIYKKRNFSENQLRPKMATRV